MRRVKLRIGTLMNNVALLAWALAVAFLLSLILFGALITAAYVADELGSPSVNEASYPPPRPDQR
jgi:hypothetical protein